MSKNLLVPDWARYYMDFTVQVINFIGLKQSRNEFSVRSKLADNSMAPAAGNRLQGAICILNFRNFLVPWGENDAGFF
ncbi:hypothetical protein VTN96DRAFT_597 [Rasamsonia emersonii]